MGGRLLRPRWERLLTASAVALALLSAGCTSAAGPSPASSASTGPTSSPAPASTRAVAGSTSAAVVSTRAAAVSTPAVPGSTGISTRASISPRTTRTSAPTATVTRTRPGVTVTVTVAPPKATAEPAATDGTCPYLSADVVSEITGQHHGQTQLVPFTPHPMCVFYRSDGDLMGSVRIIQAGTAVAAAAAVDQHVPVAGSQPATAPAGWTGGSTTSPGQMTQDSKAMSVYAVSKGTVAMVTQENESPSLKARLMTVCAIYGLGLQSGPAPDYCAHPQQ